MTAAGINAAAALLNTTAGVAHAVGNGQKRLAHMQQAQMQDRELFQQSLDEIYEKMSAINSEFNKLAMSGTMTEEQAAQFWRENEEEFRINAYKLEALQKEAQMIDYSARIVISNMEVRMNQWELTKWLKDHGWCTIL